jgi:DNA polymerase (family X)
MNNKQIAAKFDLLAKLMELHDENPFKIKSYVYAFGSLRKLEGDMSSMTTEELTKIPGIGASIVDKIREIISTGDMKVLADWRAKTPEGVQDMLRIKGLGPKKVKQIWQEMEIDSIGELLYACQENRLVNFKGFGEKLQAEIKDKLEYFISSQGKYLHAHVEGSANQLVEALRSLDHTHQVEIVGGVRRGMPIVDGIEILTTMDVSTIENMGLDTLEKEEDTAQLTYHGWNVFFHQTTKDSFAENVYNRSAEQAWLDKYPPIANAKTDEEILAHHGLPYIPTECREGVIIEAGLEHHLSNLINTEDIKGIVHNHSTYSDGLHSLEKMATYVKENGFDYFVISDHSKSAGYAGGLQIERVEQQWREIDQLNAKLGPDFKIYKSIESDILIDGSLDYPDEILGGFDLVVASIHSGLQMDEAKATARLITAIENPYTRILGHPTSRLLLSRLGYPIDHRKIIDACAANGVAIELNANPQRLDIDWTWIPYCIQKNVLVAINPDAHSMQSIHYIKNGVLAARKGGLTREMCLNTMDKTAFDNWLKS